VAALAHSLGWCAEVAQSSQDLQDRLRAGRAPDAVVIEPGPRHVAGLQALADLKRALGPGHMPPFVLVRPGGPGPLREAACDHLADAVIGHPATAAGLFNAINAALIERGGDHQRLTRLTHLEAAQACCLPGVRVLVVDDCSINRDVARRILEREGAIVTVCVNGREAVDAAAPGPAVDLVLMDMQMPELDGDAATRCIRGELQLTQLPVLALTAGALKAEQQPCAGRRHGRVHHQAAEPDGPDPGRAPACRGVSGCAVPLVPRPGRRRALRGCPPGRTSKASMGARSRSA
jgi:CheY-like chemotaxis protein